MLVDLWRILKKRMWIIAAVTLVVFTMITIWTYRTTPLYEATSRISISKENNDTIGINNRSNADADSSYDINMELDTQARILSGDTLALQVIDSQHLADNPAFYRPTTQNQPNVTTKVNLDTKRQTEMLARWHDSLSVNKIPRTRIIEIKFLSPDPRLAAQIVNTLASSYVENDFQVRFKDTQQHAEWLSAQLNDLQRKVETSQEALVRYQKDNGIIGLDEKQNIVTNKLDELNKELTAAEGDRVQKQANYQLTFSGDLDSIPELSNNTLVQKLRESESDLQKQLAQATTQFGPSYPKVIELQNQIKQVDSSIAKEVDRIASRKRSEYKAAVNREKMLQTAMDQQKALASQQSEKAITYQQLRHEADSNRALYDSLQEKLKEATVTSGLKSSNVRMEDRALVPLTPAKPNIPRNLLMGLLLGFMGGFGLAFVLESLDNTVRTPEQVETIALLPSLGMIPLSLEATTGARYGVLKSTALTTAADATRVHVGIISHSRPKSEIAESYRALRTSILLSSIGHAPKVIMLTSALPQEGKTTTSVNTAIVLAQKGGRILLVDADMRRPSIHQTLKLRNRSGLSTLLTGSTSFEQSILQSNFQPNLYIMTAGPPPPHPAELLGSSVMKEYLNRWREEFDHIVIDTPPVLSVTDAVLLSVETDAVVLVIRSSKTTKDALRRSRDLLTQVNARVLGVVVNAVDLKSSDSYYYYYGSNYGGRYYDESARGSSNS